MPYTRCYDCHAHYWAELFIVTLGARAQINEQRGRWHTLCAYWAPHPN